MLIIFDLDDTLIDTSDLFWKVREEFLSSLEVSEMTLEQIRDEFEEEDTRSIEEYGYHPSRYGKTMRKVYNNLVASNLIREDESVKNRIDSIGMKIMHENPVLIDGALDALERLKERRHSLALVTRGDEDAQTRKINVHGLDNYFDFISVVAGKNANTFKGVMDQFCVKPEDTWLIGDSIRSDINPGLCAGANCIHFMYQHPAYHWIQEHGDKPVSSNFYSVGHLKFIPEVIGQHQCQKNFRSNFNEQKSHRPQHDYSSAPSPSMSYAD